MRLKLYTAEFSPMWPVPSGLIIAAQSMEEAVKIAKETVKHTLVTEVKEITPKQAGVVFYESGAY